MLNQAVSTFPSTMRDFHCFVMLVSGLYIFLLCATPAMSDECFLVTIYSLKTAECDNLNLKTIPKDLDSDLKVLKFSENQLTFLGVDEFLNYQRLQEIYLVRNRIEVIAPDAFRGLRNLQILDLEGNKLHVIPKDTFQHLSSVRILRFKSNMIRYISDDTFDMLTSIEELDFENCWLERVEPNVFKGLNNLHEVNLVNNELKTLSSVMEGSLPPSLKVFRLYTNPWQCDCRLRWLRDWLSRNAIDWDFAHNVPTCDGPFLTRANNWRKMTADQFACPARIVASNSTSVELPIGGNVTIECHVYGEPAPKITWTKGTKSIKESKKIEVPNEQEKEYKSSLMFSNVQVSHSGDYKCIAENFAGRSEVTYKLWIEGIGPNVDTEESSGDESGLSKEAYLGIGVAVAVLLLLIVICVIYGLKKRELKRHEYKVRDYKKPNKGACGKDASGFDEEDQTHIKDKAKESVATVGSETEKKELLDKKDSNASQVSKHDAQITITAQTNDLIAAENKHLLPKTESVKEPIEKEKLKDEETESFQMKIFSTYSEQQKEQMKQQQELAKQQQQQQQQQPEQNNLGASSPIAVEPVFAKANGKIASKETSEILRNGKHSTANHKAAAVPVLPPTVPNHLESAHQRAAENPYAKPSELRPATRKSGSADDLLDCNKHHTNKDRGKEKEVTFKDPPTTTRAKTFSKNPSPKGRDHHKHCNNPVCLKDHTLMPDAPQLRGSQSLTGMNTVGTPGGLQEIDVDHIVDPVYHRSGLSDRYVDRYRTLPSKSSSSSSRHPGSSASKHYSPPTTAIHSPARGGTPSAMSPYQTLPGRGSPTKHRVGSPNRGLHDRYAGFPPPPASAYGMMTPRGAMSSPEDNITYGPFSSSPPKAARRTFQGSATLDELLSPPFGNIATGAPRQAGGRSPSAKKLPKPGEKDEFGTAV